VTLRARRSRNRPRLSSLRVLLVEDSLDNQLLIRAYLRGTGCVLDIAGNGRSGVEMFRAGRYDVVLMDVQLPGLDGFDATRAIRSWERENARAATPVVALTAEDSTEARRESLVGGCSDLLGKPIARAALLDALLRVRAEASP
jgi:CheY-like chemotaxis protein